MPYPFPPRAEQRAIADFLDRETAKIDTLVARKRTLIERLKEKRTALISRTVTRGLPPDAATQAGLDPHPKLKPSGVDWLGDVPEHWEVKRLKRGVRFVEGPAQSWLSNFCDSGVPLLRYRGHRAVPEPLSTDATTWIPTSSRSDGSHFRVRQADLLISGSASTGFCSEVDETTEAGDTLHGDYHHPSPSKT